jgi:hypothetical protein
MFPHQPSVVSGALTGVYVQIASSDETLQLATSEAYSLSVPVSGVAQITAPNVYAALRGLETLRHVVFFPLRNFCFSLLIHLGICSQLVFFNFTSRLYFAQETPVTVKVSRL